MNRLEKNNVLEASIENCRLEEKHENENNIMECSVGDCNSVLNFNKQLICSLLDLKKHITFALQKCEKKLTLIETSLQKHTVGDTKVLICNAGIPYFKDRNYFFAPNNEDEILKENQKELQLRNLPKVSLWTIKERNILLKAIKKEAIADALCSQKLDCMPMDDPEIKASLKVENEKEAGETFPPTDFLEMVGPLKGKEFDWFKISSIHFDDVHSPLDCRVMWNVFLHPDINKNVWTKSEDVKLKEMVKKHKFQNWDKISKDMNTNRTAYQCFIRYNTTKKLPKVQNYTWNADEDRRLLKLIDIFKIGDFIPWSEVANWIKNRTKQQVYFRWSYSLAPYLIKGRFTKTEDRILKDAVTKYGTNFRKISAALMPNRSTVQLHDRYHTLSAKQIENSKIWTFAEDSKLLKLYARFGPNWSRIAKAFSRKTRTQLRHRHTALQKYIKRGVSLFDLHRNQNPDANEPNEERTGDNTFRSVIDSSKQREDTEVDEELIKYFCTQLRARFIRKNGKLYTGEELSHDTKCLYGILQRLNAEVHIPDNISDLKLTERDRQLARSFNEYSKLKNDKQRCFEIMEKCSLHMFGADHNNKGASHFIPPPPFDFQIKSKRPDESERIDYPLHTNDKFLLEKSVEMDTADLVISQIGGYEQQLQFQKFTRSLQSTDATTDVTGKSCYSERSCTRPTRKMLLHRSADSSRDSKDKSKRIGPIARSFKENGVVACRNVKLPNKCYNKELCEQIVQNNYTLFNIPDEIGPSRNLDTEIIGEEDVSVVEATYATISCFRNLLHFKRSSEKLYIIQSNQCFGQESCDFREAVKLLETRLEQLFRYPIGLSKTAVPQVYAIDAVEDGKQSKRKFFNVSDVQLDKHQIKKLQIFDINGKPVS